MLDFERVTSPASYAPRTGAAVARASDSIVLFGGTDQNSRLNDVHVYKNQVWNKLEPRGHKPSPRSGATATFAVSPDGADCVYVFGGHDGRNGAYFNDLHVYDMKNNAWKEIVAVTGSPPPGRTDHTCVLFGRRLLVFGGFNGERRFNDVCAFDLTDLSWSENLVPKPPDERAAVAAAKKHRKDKCAGPSLLPPTPRFGHSAVVKDGYMYVFGGWNGRTTLSEFWRLEIDTMLWTWLRPRRKLRHVESDGLTFSGEPPCGRYRHACCSIWNGQGFFLFGGIDRQQTRFNDSHVFDFERMEWSSCELRIGARVPKPRTFHACCVGISDDDASSSSSRIAILCGFTGERRLDDHWEARIQRSAIVPSLQSMVLRFVRKEYDQLKEEVKRLPRAFVEDYVFRSIESRPKKLYLGISAKAFTELFSNARPTPTNAMETEDEPPRTTSGETVWSGSGSTFIRKPFAFSSPQRRLSPFKMSRERRLDEFRVNLCDRFLPKKRKSLECDACGTHLDEHDEFVAASVLNDVESESDDDEATSSNSSPRVRRSHRLGKRHLSSPSRFGGRVVYKLRRSLTDDV